MYAFSLCLCLSLCFSLLCVCVCPRLRSLEEFMLLFYSGSIMESRESEEREVIQQSGILCHFHCLLMTQPASLLLYYTCYSLPYIYCKYFCDISSILKLSSSCCRSLYKFGLQFIVGDRSLLTGISLVCLYEDFTLKEQVKCEENGSKKCLELQKTYSLLVEKLGFINITRLFFWNTETKIALGYGIEQN